MRQNIDNGHLTIGIIGIRRQSKLTKLKKAIYRYVQLLHHSPPVSLAQPIRGVRASAEHVLQRRKVQLSILVACVDLHLFSAEVFGSAEKKTGQDRDYCWALATRRQEPFRVKNALQTSRSSINVLLQAWTPTCSMPIDRADFVALIHYNEGGTESRSTWIFALQMHSAMQQY